MMVLRWPANCEFITQSSTCDHLHTWPTSGRFAAGSRAPRSCVTVSIFRPSVFRCAQRCLSLSLKVYARTVRYTSCSIGPFEWALCLQTYTLCITQRVAGPVCVCVWVCMLAPQHHISCDISGFSVRSLRMHGFRCIGGATTLDNTVATVCSTAIDERSFYRFIWCANELPGPTGMAGVWVLPSG